MEDSCGGTSSKQVSSDFTSEPSALVETSAKLPCVVGFTLVALSSGNKSATSAMQWQLALKARVLLRALVCHTHKKRLHTIPVIHKTRRPNGIKAAIFHTEVHVPFRSSCVLPQGGAGRQPLRARMAVRPCILPPGLGRRTQLNLQTMQGHRSLPFCEHRKAGALS